MAELLTCVPAGLGVFLVAFMRRAFGGGLAIIGIPRLLRTAGGVGIEAAL
jgi:hypothetical protein